MLQFENICSINFIIMPTKGDDYVGRAVAKAFPGT
jgi:hypothetical protein